MQETAVNVGTREALVFLILCEIAGLIYVSLVTGIIIISNFGKAEGFICGMIAAYVPYFLFNNGNSYTKVPLPSAFLAPYNFLDKINTYRLQYILTALIIIGIIFIMEAVYTHEKAVIRIVICIIMLIMLTSCIYMVNTKNAIIPDNSFEYDFKSKQTDSYVELDDYVITYNSDRKCYEITDKETQAKRKLFNEMTDGGHVMAGSMTSQGNTLYYGDMENSAATI